MEGLLQFLTTIVEYVTGFFQTIIDFFLLVVKGIAYLLSVITFLPDYFKLAVLPIIAISVILFVTNRG